MSISETCLVLLMISFDNCFFRLLKDTQASSKNGTSFCFIAESMRQKDIRVIQIAPTKNYFSLCKTCLHSMKKIFKSVKTVFHNTPNSRFFHFPFWSVFYAKIPKSPDETMHLGDFFLLLKNIKIPTWNEKSRVELDFPFCNIQNFHIQKSDWRYFIIFVKSSFVKSIFIFWLMN